ncbi:helix-turn-helix domain-containing protein [Alkalibacterium sp.]
MWTLIPAKERKLYTLIESLFYSEKPLNLNELSKRVGSSKRSVSDYIDELKVRIEASGGELTSNPEGFLLVFPDNLSIDTFQYQLLQSTPSLKLLELLLIKDELTGLELENELFVSSASLSRMITRLKETLADYGLGLEHHPYRLTGDEFLIRRLYTSYYLEAYGYENWPFQSVSFDEISELVNSLAQSDSVQFETVNVQKFLLFTSVSVIREKHNHPIYTSQAANDCIHKEEFKRISGHVRRWLSSVMSSVDKIEMYTRIFSHYMFYYFRSYTQKSINLTRIDHQDFIKDSLLDICRTFDLPETDFSHIAGKIDDSLYLCKKNGYSHALGSYLFFKPRDYALLIIYSSQYPKLYQSLKEMMEQLYEKYGINESKIDTEEFLYLIISRWDQLSLHLYEKYTVCRVLVYSPLSYRHADNIARLLNSKLERACDVNVYSEPFLTVDKLKQYDYDILVSTCSLSLDITQPIITLHSKVSGKHLHPLLSAIDSAVQKNREKIREEKGL